MISWPDVIHTDSTHAPRHGPIGQAIATRNDRTLRYKAKPAMRSTGDLFEDRACAVLQRAGLTLLARNFNTRHGELDLVMLDRRIVVFVEVRYRKSQRCGSALDSVTIGKQRKLILAARTWLAAHPRHAQRPCRFDVVCYDGPPEHVRMGWVRDAFTTEQR